MTDHIWLQAKPLRHGEIWERRGSDDVAIYNPETGALALLNPSALAIWELCDGETEILEIAEAVALVTGEPNTSLDIRRLVEDLARLGLVREATQSGTDRTTAYQKPAQTSRQQLPSS